MQNIENSGEGGRVKLVFGGDLKDGIAGIWCGASEPTSLGEMWT